ncbi:hypothetical protein H8Z78_13595 [Dysosmobacter sp. NSJ-60]|nr:hypothetical protein [Dysosmobacter hominis]
MKRLTSKGFRLGKDNSDLLPSYESIYHRLFAIEDILGDEYDLDRLRELAQADREGRCVVLPLDDYTWTIRGDIVRGIIKANCRAAKKEAEAALRRKQDG